jgi:hypothetical protein
MMKFAALAAALPLVDAHVRANFDGIPIRNAGQNAPQPTANGVYSTSGPCGGATEFGRNGIQTVQEGDTLQFTMNYNGHANENNAFMLAFQCGGQNGQDQFRQASGAGRNQANPSRLLAYGTAKAPVPPAQATQPVTLTMTVPAPEDGDKGELCTVSMLEQQDWGSCFDLRILASDSSEPTEAPRSIEGKTLAGTYTIDSSNCVADSPNCCCGTGSITIDHTEGSRAAGGSMTMTYPCGRIDGVTSRSFSLSNPDKTDTLVGTASGGKAEGQTAFEDLEVSVIYGSSGNSVTVTSKSADPQICGMDTEPANMASPGVQTMASAIVAFGLVAVGIAL